MWTVTIIAQEHEVFRPSEIIADLRTVAEALYFPFKMVGFWDSHADMHLCPQEQRRMECPHRPSASDSGLTDDVTIGGPAGDGGLAAYEVTASKELGATLKVKFPHAKVCLYMR